LAFIPEIIGLPRPDPFLVTCMTDTWVRNYMRDNGYPSQYWLIHRKFSVSVIQSFRLSVGLPSIADSIVSFQLNTSVGNPIRLVLSILQETRTSLSVSSHIA
jgi:hypothetical protein